MLPDKSGFFYVHSIKFMAVSPRACIVMVHASLLRKTLATGSETVLFLNAKNIRNYE
jgi:hypothetical protein